MEDLRDRKTVAGGVAGVSPSSGSFLSPELREGETAREATWLVTPEAELARARRAGTALSTEFFLRAPFQTLFAALGVGLFLWSLVPALRAEHAGDALFALLGLGALCLGLLPIVRKWERNVDAAKASEREIEAEFWPNVGRLVSVIVRQGDAPTGEDVGMLWFEDGRLYFSGYRTSFGLVPSQIRGGAELRDAVARVRHGVELTLQLQTPVGPMRLCFQEWIGPRADLTAAQARLQVDLDRWKDCNVEGTGQWPPVTLGPRVVSANLLLAGAVAWSLLPAGALALLVFAVTLVPDYAKVAFFGTAFGFIAVVPACNLRWRALRDRRRLRDAW